MTEAGFTAEQCRRYALSLPISVLACGIQSPENLKQDVDMARTFSPMSEEEMQDREKEEGVYKTVGSSLPAAKVLLLGVNLFPGRPQCRVDHPTSVFVANVYRGDNRFSVNTG